MIPAPSILPDLSPLAEETILSAQLFDDCQSDDGIWIPDWKTGQELVDAGLIARTRHPGGAVSYRLRDAGRRWRLV